MATLITTKFDELLHRHAEMERAAVFADLTGDEGPFEIASDARIDAENAIRTGGTDDDKRRLKPYLVEKYAADF